MGYLKMTLASGDVKTILADGILSIEDGSGATEIDIAYSGASSSVYKTLITATSASDRDDLKVAVRDALVKYQGNQEGPAIEANGGKSVSNVTSG
tara:strand:+ start:6467 stop:6751 length:285 start_codon:yes stop_codon:yes gene_type:complete